MYINSPIIFFPLFSPACAERRKTADKGGCLPSLIVCVCYLIWEILRNLGVGGRTQEMYSFKNVAFEINAWLSLFFLFLFFLRKRAEFDYSAS